MNKIGEGSYGIVYKARWRDQEVAVKRFKSLDKEQQENFSIEASIMM
jgi:predicted Ser/Thr protein kinase